MVRKDIKTFLSTIPNDVHLVAASKYATSDDIRVLFNAGVSIFGENRVESLIQKQTELKDLPIQWHFIGHLQRNKARKIINSISCLHSLDSLPLASIINQYRQSPLDCFVEVSINLEENKNGVPYFEAINFVKECLQYPNIHLVGLMMMAVAGSDPQSLDKQFETLYQLRNQIEKELNISLPYLSMGMSDDYLIAVKHHATHIRLGRILFKNKTR